ncbi:MAG: hypothetical protein VR65_14060 [Desulfobulbaceae bacterium BRH_c16a]|nr:MAG: hypothetical protein VR65_14060 [Desulfobulbaceae bacterium BRH_c16a]
MKKIITYSMALLITLTLSFGVSQAVSPGTGETKTKSETVSPSTETGMSAGEQQTLSGKIDENNQFVNEEGETFRLADNEKGMEVKTLSGMKVEIKGTVMEEAGQKTVEVQEYHIIE